MNRSLIILMLASLPWAAAYSQSKTVHAASNTATPTLFAKPVARVNGVLLTERDLRREMDRLFPFYSVHGGRIPPQLEPEIKSKAFDRMVLSELIYEEAAHRKISVADSAVAARVRNTQKKFPSLAAYRDAITKAYGTQAEFRRSIHRALIVEKLWEMEVIRPARASESELRKIYDQDTAHYSVPESVKLQTISIEVPEKSSAMERLAIRARAENLLTQSRAAKTYGTFGALAEKVSSDDWRVMNGDHGWVHRDAVDPELEVVFTMKPGETSELVKSKYGYHILRVNDRRPARLMPFAEAKAVIQKAVLTERQRQLSQKFEQQLRAKAKIEKL